jgi:hypothetical protein
MGKSLFENWAKVENAVNYDQFDMLTYPSLIQMFEGRKEVAKKIMQSNGEKEFDHLNEIFEMYNKNIISFLGI